jgi:hypothetical protein
MTCIITHEPCGQSFTEEEWDEDKHWNECPAFWRNKIRKILKRWTNKK